MGHRGGVDLHANADLRRLASPSARSEARTDGEAQGVDLRGVRARRSPAVLLGRPGKPVLSLGATVQDEGESAKRDNPDETAFPFRNTSVNRRAALDAAARWSITVQQRECRAARQPYHLPTGTVSGPRSPIGALRTERSDGGRAGALRACSLITMHICLKNEIFALRRARLGLRAKGRLSRVRQQYDFAPG